MSLQEWIDDIVQEHHQYLRDEIPVIENLLRQQDITMQSNPNWRELFGAFLDLKRELMMHLLKEEVMLFPSMLHMQKAYHEKIAPDLKRHDLRESLGQAEQEHEATESFLETIMQKMKGIPCTAELSELFNRFEMLGQDLKEHIDKEEKGLFPEARYYYSQVTQGMLREE